MSKNSIRTVDLIVLLLGQTDTGAGVPRALPGHVQDRIASMGDGAARPGKRKRLPRRRAT
jgi:hypothetical protein